MKNQLNKTIIITGGSGYVGSRTALKLSNLGYKVIVVDIITPEERGIIFSRDIEFRQHDLRIPHEADVALQGGDLVLHLAADIGSLTYMHNHQAEIMVNNGAIDAAVYPAILKNKIPWIIYSSSSMVFQHSPKFPYSEDDITGINPPTNVYGFSKLSGEYFCRSFLDQYGLTYTILRYHNIYGAGEDSKGSTPGDIHVIPALLEKVFDGQYPLEFLGNPEATRPFTYIDDVVDATIEITLRALRGDDAVRNTDFNIGNETYYQIRKLGEIIWNLYGDERPFEYRTQETKADTALRREVDISKIKETIGWSPTTTLEEGLVPTAEWIQKRKSGKRSLWG